MMVNTKYQEVENGIRSKLYNGFPYLNMQISKKNEFIATPDWYYNIEYIEEQNRGSDFREEFVVRGICEFPIKKGESVIFSASVDAVSTGRLKTKFPEIGG